MNNIEIINFIKNLNIYKSKYEIFLKNHYSDIYQKILDKTNFLDINYNRKITFAERLYCIENNIESPLICPVCQKNLLNFNTDISKYRNSCSSICSKKSKITIEKRAKTKLERYGNSGYCNNIKAKETRYKNYNGNYTCNNFKEKIKSTLKEKYNNENYNNIEKYKQTCIEKYGTDHPMKNIEFKKQYLENINLKYGVNSVFELDFIKEKTNKGIRNRAWKFLSEHTYNVELITTKEEFFKIKNLNDKNALKFKCKLCSTEFNSFWDNGYAMQCPQCFPKMHGTSQLEKQVEEFISNFYICDINNKKIIPPLELDIYIPEKKLAIEFDGLYWHSEEAGKSRNYHLDKTLECEKQGIQLIHIFENEWLTKQDIVKSRIKNLLGIYDKTIFARKCEIKEVDNKISKEFQDKNHIQGSVNSKISLGLYFEDELISLMTFGKCRFNKKYEYELLRFCNKLGYHIPGSASKLLKYFERNYNPKSLISYADRRWSQGKVYKSLNFKFIKNILPNYWYLKNNNTSKLFSRIKYQKHKLKNILENFDENKTEVENMKANGYNRIFDCGNMVFEKIY